MDLSKEKAEELLESESRRNFLKATGSLAAVVGVASGQLDSNKQGNISGGTMALNEAYKVAEEDSALYIGPDSAKDSITPEDGDRYEATDTFVKYHGDGGSWGNPEGIGSTSKPVPSINTDHIHSESKYPTVTIWTDSGGTIFADGPSGEVASGTDAYTVIQAAIDSLTEGGTVFVRNGIYTFNDGLTFGNRGVELRGEGRPWVRNNDKFGTIFEASDSFPTDGTHVIDLASQFTAIRQLAVNGRDSAPVGVITNYRDTFIQECGISRFTDHNLRLNSTNNWVQNNLIEYAGQEQIQIDLFRQSFIENNFIIGEGAKGILFDNNVESGQIKGNYFGNNSIAISGDAYTLTNAVIAGNTFKGVGKGGTSGWCFYSYGSSEDVVIALNSVNAEDVSGTLHTESFVRLDSNHSIVDEFRTGGNVVDSDISGVREVNNGTGTISNL